MCGDLSNCTAHLSKIRDVFDGNFVTLQVAPHGNAIVFAFKERRREIDWEKLESTGTNLKRRFEPGFVEIKAGMALDWKLRRWQSLST